MGPKRTRLGICRTRAPDPFPTFRTDSLARPQPPQSVSWVTHPPRPTCLYLARQRWSTPMTSWGQLSGKNSGPVWRLISNVYDTLHLALWSLFVAFIIFFCVFTLPRLPQFRAKMEAERILSLQAENSVFVRSGPLRSVPRSTRPASWTYKSFARKLISALRMAYSPNFFGERTCWTRTRKAFVKSNIQPSAGA
jgi:hypothetical protein